MSSDISHKVANLKPQKVVVPKVWKRPHSTIYGKNVEFGSKLYSDKLGEINGRKFNSELPWQVRNSGPSSISGSSSSQGYLSKLFTVPQSTLVGSVITPSGCRDTRAGSAGAAAALFTSPVGSSLSSASSPSSYYYNDHHDRDSDELTNEYDKYLDRKSRLTPSSCSNYADVLELTNPNRYSKRRSEQLAANNTNRRMYSNNLLHENNNTSSTPTTRKRIDFYDNYLETFNEDIKRMQETSRLANDPLLQRRLFDKYLDFNYELGLFVPSFNSDSMNNSNDNRRMMFHDDGRSLMHKKTIHWHPSSSAAIGDETEEAATRHQQQQNPNYFAPVTTTSRPQNTPHYPAIDYSQDHQHHQQALTNTNFNPVVTTTKQTHLLPKHACQLSDSPYGQSADGRKLSLGSINPHSYRPSLPQRTTTVHASDGEEFEFQDRSSPFYTDRWAGRTIRHFDSDLYSNASLFKSMIL